MIYRGINNEFIELKEIKSDQELVFDQELNSPLLFVWIKEANTTIKYEGISLQVPKNTIVCLTKFHKIEFNDSGFVRFIKFNREFYCVLDHDNDNEVSCKGLLFYGAHELPKFQIPDDELEKFETLWRMFQIELESKDELQLGMLQMMLKRFMILCTRIYKAQRSVNTLKNNEVDILRDFNFLVEQHFRTKHSINDYAEILHKSPKTLSNIFSKCSDKTPLRIIHERIALEAKRLLRYTDKPIKEIAYEVGFEDLQSFSRFFKKTEKISPSEFKKLS